MTDEELKLSKERLMKLWDAYEAQERELTAALFRVKELEEKERDKERVIATLRELIETKDAELRKLEVKEASLDRETTDCKGRLQEVSDSLNLEKGRYRKLYVLTQELEREVDRLTKELDARDRWFHDNLSFLEELPQRMGKRLEMAEYPKRRSLLDELEAPIEETVPEAPSETTFEKVDPGTKILKDLLDIPGVDEDKARILMKSGYDSKEKLTKASPFDLVKLDGITPTLARRITDHIKA